MKPIVPGGHSAYQLNLICRLQKYYPDIGILTRTGRMDLIESFYQLDLSKVDVIMQDQYSAFGPVPRPPSCMLRSVMLSHHLQVTSITHWVSELRTSPLYAILSGFDPNDTPGIGTFYDFFSRLWMSDSDNLSDHVRPPKAKPKKPKKDGDKAPPVEKITAAELFEQFSNEPPSMADPCSLLFRIFHEVFLTHSAELGLIDLLDLSLSGDGTPVRTATRERKKRLCNCLENGTRDCSCDRYFSQPDCDVGYDSHRKCHYPGYDLYMLTDSASGRDLPIFPLLNPASRHDSHGFVYAWFAMLRFLPDIGVTKVQLDSAHDAMVYYKYFMENGITPFIDLNDKRGAPSKYGDDLMINLDCMPVCPQGHVMRKDGRDLAKRYLKFKCPMMSWKGGLDTPVCTCEHPCSDAKYGRTARLHMSDDPRLINFPPRGSEEWKLEYNARTASERCNKREKIDYKLEDGRHRSTKMWYCRLYSIMMCQHHDAWDLSQSRTILNSLS